MTHFVVSSSLKRVERLEHLERLEPAKSGRFIFAEHLAACCGVRDVFVSSIRGMT